MQFPTELLGQCWFLCGPTACGKTALSLSLAMRLGAEIVALDSMTLYRGMDIGTAKASLSERDRVPHHLIDILEPHEECSLADYMTAAETACRGIVKRGRRPLFVGGTGLYLRGILRGVFEGPSADWNLRRELQEQLRNDGPVALHSALECVDPITALRLHPNDTRRVIRAIEVYRLTGSPLSSQQAQGPRPASECPTHVYWLSPPRDWLYSRINERVQQMFELGLVNEVRNLMRRPQRLSHTARQALGYKEVIDWLESEPDIMSGNSKAAIIPPAHILELIQTRTRQFAKRQHTWFRNLPECIPIEITGEESVAELSDQIAAQEG